MKVKLNIMIIFFIFIAKQIITYNNIFINYHKFMFINLYFIIDITFFVLSKGNFFDYINQNGDDSNQYGYNNSQDENINKSRLCELEHYLDNVKDSESLYND
jgi:hypothetical protein